MRLDALIADLSSVRVDGPLDREVGGVTRDSRQVRPDSVFVAVLGATVDGHDFVAGLDCAAVVIERDVPTRPGVTRLWVPSAKAALAELAAALHGHPGRRLPVVGVTGTNGKTTVTTLVEQAYAVGAVPIGRIGTTGITIAGEEHPAAFTTPEAPELQRVLAEMVDRGCRLAVMEVSSIGLAQHRVDGIPFALGVFTNLTQDHLDFHGTMDAYRAAKSRLFSSLLRPAGGAPRALAWRDDPQWTSLGLPDDHWTYGTGPQVSARDVALAVVHSDGVETLLSAHTPAGTAAFSTRLVGRHNLVNLAAALGILLLQGVPLDDAARWLAGAQGAPGRLERVPDPSGRVVLVDYAHSDDALANVLPAARELARGTVTVVFGCGGDRDRGKRPKMAAVAEALADRVIVTTDNPRSEAPEAIARDIVAGLTHPERARVVLDREAAIREALASTVSGDVVVIAGKGHETYQEIGGERRPFDDRAVAARWIREEAR
jgi:UDP-N-acetylmuramoyl-L-alanyl-D-glutamate--2,6-diaminopimelate ligase